MSIYRFLAIIFVFGLMTGCSTFHKHNEGANRLCPPPGHPNQTDGICVYRMMVNDVKLDTKKVIANVPQSVIDENKKNEAEAKRTYDLRDYPTENQYNFFVDDVTGIKKGELFEFHSVPSSDLAFTKKLKSGLPTCPPPNQYSEQECLYTLSVVSINTTTGMVTAKVPPSVVKANMESGEKAGMEYKKLARYDFDKKYTFHVGNLVGITEGKTYQFITVPGRGDKKIGELKLDNDQHMQGHK